MRPAPTSRTERALLALLLVATAVGYLWDLSASGFANSFYAAAVEAGTKSWKAFFFGSLDSSNFITVDKPPASLWVMDLSGRIFGFSSWSMLVPEALMGVAAVALVYAAVRRSTGPAAGLLAGTALATTPVAALMFRFNNPDALMVLLMAAGAYCVTRAIERGSTRWLVLCGATVGFAFLAKMLEAMLVVPGFGLAYLVAAPVPWRRKVLQSLAGAGAAVASAGWWVAAVALWPVSDRPMIDGSPTNSILNLILAYNGLDRVLGNGSGPGGGGGGNFSGATGVFRLFNDLMGGQASWLLPAAAGVLVAGLVLTCRRPITDRARAALIVWGGWLVVAGGVFSLSKGTIHTYYTVALAPPVAALVGMGAAELWRRRRSTWAKGGAGVAVAGTAAWSVALLDRSPTWEPWLRPLVIGAAGAFLVTLAAAELAHRRRRVDAFAGRPGDGLRGPSPRSPWGRANAVIAAGAASLAVLAGPVAYAADTVTTAHTGSVPSAGPTTSAGGFGGVPGGSGGGFGGGTKGAGRGAKGFGGGAGGLRGAPGGGAKGFGGTTKGVGGAKGFGGGTGGAPSGGSGTRSLPAGAGSAPSSSRSPSGSSKSTKARPTTGGGGARSFAGAGGGGGFGGTSTSSALVKLLEAGAGHYRWVAVTSGSQEAASLELASGGDPVMAIGGFAGEGGNISLAAFERYVHEGEIHYLVASGGGGGGPGGGGSWSEIETWVEAHFTAKTVGGTTVYDLTNAK